MTTTSVRMRLSFALGGSVPGSIGDREVGHRIPGIVDSDEEKKKRCNSDREERRGRVAHQEERGNQSRDMANDREHGMPDPVAELGSVLLLVQRPPNHDKVVQETGSRTNPDAPSDRNQGRPRSAE